MSTATGAHTWWPYSCQGILESVLFTQLLVVLVGGWGQTELGGDMRHLAAWCHGNGHALACLPALSWCL